MLRSLAPACVLSVGPAVLGWSTVVLDCTLETPWTVVVLRPTVELRLLMLMRPFTLLRPPTTERDEACM